MNGNKVSHSNIKSPKRAKPNIQNKRVFDVETGRWVRLKVTAKGLKVLNKKCRAVAPARARRHRQGQRRSAPRARVGARHLRRRGRLPPRPLARRQRLPK